MNNVFHNCSNRQWKAIFCLTSANINKELFKKLIINTIIVPKLGLKTDRPTASGGFFPLPFYVIKMYYQIGIVYGLILIVLPVGLCQILF